MGEVKLSDALKTIEGICKFYSVRDFVIEADGRIAVYNCQKDNFHFFRWETNRYIFCGEQDSVINWRDKRIAV